MNDTELRELDAWIAEHVMGWGRTDAPDDLTDTDEVLFWRREASEGRSQAVLVGDAYVPYGGKRFDRSWKKFHPSELPADAMRVLEKCVIKCDESGDSVDLSFTKQVGEFEAGRMQLGFEWEIELSQKAPTLPLAICLFARKLFSK